MIDQGKRTLSQILKKKEDAVVLRLQPGSLFRFSIWGPGEPNSVWKQEYVLYLTSTPSDSNADRPWTSTGEVYLRDEK